MHRSFLWVLAVGAPAVAGFDVALADTRIFSVQTDREGTTVTAIERNGEALEQVGQSGARTFFEIDDGEATVPCSNQLAFTTSDDQRIEYIVDLCAHNWQVTLPVGTAAVSPGGETAPASELGSLTIYTDDPAVGIDAVSLDTVPMTIASRQGKAVAVEFPNGEEAVKCERDLALTLDDGRRISRTVDVCVPDGVIVVALDEPNKLEIPDPPPAEAPGVADTPSAVPPPPPVASPPAPVSPGEIELVEGLSWVFGGDANRAVLTYATANSDQVEFYGSCVRGSKEAEVALQRSAPEVRPGASATVTFTAGTYAGTFTAIGSDINALTGASRPELTIATDDPFWTALIREEFLVIQIGSAPPYALSLKGSSRAAGPFVKDCETPDVMGPPAPTGLPAAPGFPAPTLPGPVSSTAGDYPCSDEAALFSQRSNIRSRLIVRNDSARPIDLYWINNDGQRQPFLSLAPGESGVQPTFFTHPWVVADTSGRCLAIYFARNTDRRIVIGP